MSSLLRPFRYGWPKARRWMASGLQWWCAELAWFVTPVARRLGYQVEPVFLIAQATGEVAAPAYAHRTCSAPGADECIAPPDWRAFCAGRQTLVTLDPTQVMRLPISLPEAAMANIREATGYRLISESPIPVDQLCFDVHPVQPRPAGTRSNEVVVDVVLCRRSIVDALSTTLEAAGVSASVIGFSPSAHPPLAFVFLTSRGAKDARATVRRSWCLTVSALLIGLSALPATLLGAHWLTIQTRDEIRTVRESQDGMLPRYERQALVRAVQRDLAHHTGDIRLSNILNDVAHHLPRTAWLRQVRYERGTLKVHGFAPDPAAAARSLGGARIVSRVKLDTVTGTGEAPGTGPVQFELSAHVPHEASP